MRKQCVQCMEGDKLMDELKYLLVNQEQMKDAISAKGILSHAGNDPNFHPSAI
jgi:hypothetical protein